MKIKPIIISVFLASLITLLQTNIVGEDLVGNEKNSKFIFTSWDDKNSNIYVMYPDGTGLNKLTNDKVNYFSPKWSPDGKHIVYVDSATNDLYIMDADGENKVNLTNTFEYAEAYPSWSPDGNKIAYMASQAQEFSKYDIYVINSDGTGKICLTSNGQFNGFPEWSPTGELIAFVREVNGSFDLFIMNSDGSEERHLTTLTRNKAAIEALSLAWAPDGSEIAFNSDREDNFDIYVFSLIDGEIVNLLKESSSNEAFPTWSPDGKKIAFVIYYDEKTSICIMERYGDSKEMVSPGLINVGSLDWSGVWF